MELFALKSFWVFRKILVGQEGTLKSENNNCLDRLSPSCVVLPIYIDDIDFEVQAKVMVYVDRLNKVCKKKLHEV